MLHTLALISLSQLCCSFFFFQAEDGIRDLIVTGVQTCALPISAPTSSTPWCQATRSTAKNAPAPAAKSRARGDRGPYRESSRRASHQSGGSAHRERESGVEGKRGDLGGGRII